MGPASTQQILQFFFRVDGRIGRIEYVLGLTFIYSVYFAILAYVVIHDDLSPGGLVFTVLLTLPLLVALVVLLVKRCHDIGLPGSYFLLFLVPLAGVLWLIALGLLPGNAGPNRYGPPPAFEDDAAD